MNQDQTSGQLPQEQPVTNPEGMPIDLSGPMHQYTIRDAAAARSKGLDGGLISEQQEPVADNPEETAAATEPPMKVIATKNLQEAFGRMHTTNYSTRLAQQKANREAQVGKTPAEKSEFDLQKERFRLDDDF